MEHCGKCGSEIEVGVKFCPACSVALQEDCHEQMAPEINKTEPSDEEKLHKATQTIDSIAQKFGATADHSDEFDKTDAETNKVMALLAYFGFLVFVPMFAAKNSPFARYHTNQGMVLFLAMLAYIIADSIVSSLLRSLLWNALGLWSVYSICITVIDLLYVGFTIFAVIGIVNVLNGRAKDLPIIGKYRVLK